MFLQKPGYTKLIIKDLYTVWIPPVPDHSQIEGWELKRSDQFWRRKDLPKFYLERRDEEAYFQEKERKLVEEGILKQVKHFDPALERYRRQEWTRRILGHWFMNDGIPTYITGSHYFYLQWCHLDHQENNGYPLFYENQTPRFYFRQLCAEDPWCLGYLIVGGRGFGKSSEEISCMIEDLTRPGHNRHAALQSKNENDAKVVLFTEKLVPIFNEIPEFFKPEFNHGSAPETKMVFKREAKSGANAKKIKYGPEFELGNTIRYVSAKEKALDGKTLTRILGDEFAKVDPAKEADNYVRTTVNVKCVYRNNQKRGLNCETSTVEEMEKGGDQAYEKWKESDPRVRDSNGYTTSKLYKYFVSALETQTQFADQHGRIPEAKAYDFIMGERKPIEDDAVKLSGVMRKNPINEEEAFIKDASKCVFNVFIITARINELRRMPKLPGRVGKFAWVAEEDGDVEFIDDPLTGKARIWMTPDVSERGDRKIANACQFTFDDKGKKLWLPCNDDIFSSGSDPIKFVKTDDPRASKMAAYGFWNFDHTVDDQHMPVETWRSHNFMWTYHGRSEDPEDDYEQIIMALRWYGHSHMPESNIADFNKHLKSRGYNKFRIVRRDFDDSVLTQKKGLAQQESVQSVPEVQNTYIRMLKQFIQRHGMRINDLEFLMQARDFDPTNTTKFDKIVGGGYTMLASEKKVKDIDTIAEREMIKNIFTKFDVSGNRSRALVNHEDTADTLTINEILGLPSNY